MIRPGIEQSKPSREIPGKVYRASDIAGFSEPVVEAGEGYATPLLTPEPPTKKQLDYLYALGYVGLPPKTKVAASLAIEAEKAKAEEEKRKAFRANLRMDF